MSATSELETGSLALLTAAIEQINESVTITDSSANIQYVNPAFTRMTGYCAEEAIGQNTRLLKSGLQDSAYYSALWTTILDGKIWQGELLNRRKDGSLFTGQISITPVRSDAGAITHFIAIQQDVTERRATEAQWKSSEKKLEAAQQVAMVGGWELDEEACEFHASAGFLRIFGWDEGIADVPFGKVISAILPSDREHVQTALKNTLQTHEPFDLEHRVLRSDGVTRVVRSRGQAVEQESGRALRLVGTSHDITDFRLAHERLRLSEEKFRSLVANIPDVTWTATVDGQVHYVSPNVEGVYGFTDKEIYTAKSKLWFERIHPDDHNRIVAAFQKLFSEAHPFDEEFRILRKDGQWTWIHDRAYRTYEKDGIVYADGVFSDITDRKRAEDVRERLAAVVDSSNDAIISKTLDGTITAWNAGAQRLFGYSEAEAIGQSWVMLLPPERRDEEADIMASIASGKRVDHFETVRLRKDGTTVDISAMVSPIKDNSGIIVGASKIARDISERKQTDRELLRAKDAAEAANRAKSQFLANMSHEIRTPMNGVIGMAGLLLDTQLSPEQRQYAEIVRSSGEALLRVINDILDFSKIEARKLTLEMSDFDLRTVLRESVDVLAIKASEKGIALTTDLDPKTPSFLRGDPGRLRQILINLVGNAVKFTVRGEVATSVCLEGVDQSGGRSPAHEEDPKAGSVILRFTVRDTGVGFPQQNASALFEPFVQGDGSSTRRYGGTGLGLTISRQLVEMMGGHIGVESHEGKGSQFWFTAVFQKQPQINGQTSAMPITPPFSHPSAFGSVQVRPQNRGGRILVAEDNATNQAVALAILRKLGYTADVALDGAEAVRALQNTDYDAVLMDCAMPNLDGYEATRAIREGKSAVRNTRVPIIALTADAMSGDREKCLAAGMSDYLAKPIEPQKLADILHKWLTPAPGSETTLTSGGPSLVEPAVVFDHEALLARVMGDRALAAKIVAGFLTDAPRQIHILKTRLKAGDIEGVRHQAHTLKGAAATISAEALRTLCSEVEATASRDSNRALALLRQLEEQLHLFTAAVKRSGWL